MDMQKLKNLIRYQEASKFFPYDDATGLPVHAPIGKITIGVGRNLEEKGIDAIEIDQMLTNDINYFVASLEHVYPWFAGLDDVRQGVLVDMCFNLGVKGLAEFTSFLFHMEHEQYEDAATAILDSKAEQELPRRYKDCATMVKTGEWLYV